MKIDKLQCCRVFVFALLFLIGRGMAQEEDAKKVLIPRSGEGWRFDSMPDESDLDWVAADFDDASWEMGSAPLGYGEDDLATRLYFGEDPEDKPPVAYFRCAFEVADPSAQSAWVAWMRCDDGATIYLNGKEIHRFNVPAGEVTVQTFSASKMSSSRDAESRFRPFYIASDQLKVGRNVIAVSVHQSDSGSSDLVLDLSLEGLASAPVQPDSVPMVEEGFINDNEVRKRILEGAQFLIMKGGHRFPGELGQELRNQKEPARFSVPEPKGDWFASASPYERSARSVLIISSSHAGMKPGMGENHAGGFAITEDGKAVTNYHVIEAMSGGDIVTATTFDGRVFAVREILAASRKDDVVIIQLDMDGEKLTPAPIAKRTPVGAPVIAISHPVNQFFHLSRGYVSRYTFDQGRPRMTITADFARGSSGSPIFDEDGNVAGVISATRSIVYNTVPLKTDKEGNVSVGRNRGNLFLSMNHQMTLKFCVPSSSVLKLIESPASQDETVK